MNYEYRRLILKFHCLSFYANNDCNMYSINSIGCFREQGSIHNINATKATKKFVDLILKKALDILPLFAMDSPITHDSGRDNCMTNAM